MIPNTVKLTHVTWELCRYLTVTDAGDIEDMDFGSETVKITRLVESSRKAAYDKLQGTEFLDIPTDSLRFDISYRELGLVEIQDPYGKMVGRFQAVACEDSSCSSCYGD